MPLHESEAIVLRSYPLAEADRLVSFLSRSMGRMRGVAGGARKTKSRFGSALERLSYVRIWFYEKETRELVRISQCEIIESFLDAFRDYGLSIALALFSEITEAVLPEREAAERKFPAALAGDANGKTHRESGNSAGILHLVDGETGRVAAGTERLRQVRASLQGRRAGILFAERAGAAL